MPQRHWEPHHSRLQKKSMQTPAKCALCGGPHNANFSGCSKNPLNAKSAKSPTTNVWGKRKKQFQAKTAPQSQSVQQATALSNNTTNPLLVDTMS
ncbi:hypothetical protein NPIL_93911 [Nephila pilipes]|uniref:Uncharacterized protein n=1 Tax=Nephila pilipes TaxID=299642 RepID=A0A8X6P2M4_NEPPI|nr:hypothetical protein NPIL_93911 [Nephila pilipes]